MINLSRKVEKLERIQEKENKEQLCSHFYHKYGGKPTYLFANSYSIIVKLPENKVFFMPHKKLEEVLI